MEAHSVYSFFVEDPQMVNGARQSIRIFVVLLIFILLGGERNVGAQETRGELNVHFKSPRSTPLSPEKSLASLVPDGEYRVELVACEPQVVDPVSARFDAMGRLWVVEMRDYPFLLDDAVPQGRIRVLEDEDHDGFFERSSVFAEGLLDPTGLAPFRNGVIVTLAGSLIHLADADGDLRADRQEVWFEGFTTENEQLRANHPTWMLNGKIHVASGLRGGTIQTQHERWPHQDPPLSLAGRDFEFSPWGPLWEAVSGNSQFGFWQDFAGNTYACSNRNPCRMLLANPAQAARNPLLPLATWGVDVMPAAEQSTVFSLVDTFTTSHLHTGQFTAACGVYRYESNLLGAQAYGSFFACEPTASIVQQGKVSAANLIAKETIRAQAGREFLASSDPWFRPVDLFDGPDGALYVVDMHRAVVEHPDWVPTQWKETINNRAGNQAGRIYRIVPKGLPRSRAHARSSLDSASLDGLLKSLGAENRWEQESAMRLILERAAEDKSAGMLADFAQRIDHLLEQQASEAMWIRGLGVLEALERFSVDVEPAAVLGIRRSCLQRASRHPSAQVRLQAALQATAQQPMIRLAEDPSAEVRYRWLLTASAWLEVDHAGVIHQLLVASAADDPRNRVWIGRGISLLAPEIATALLRESLKSQESGTESQGGEFPPELLVPWLERLGWEGHPETLQGLLVESDSFGAASMIKAYLRGAARRGLIFSKLARGLSDVQRAALREVLGEAARAATDQSATPALRIEALGILTVDDSENRQTTLRNLLRNDSGELMESIWEHLAPQATREDTEVVVSRLETLAPTRAVKLIESLASRPNTSEVLVAVLEENQSLRGFVTPTAWERLRRHTTIPLQDRVKGLVRASSDTDRAALVTQYLGAMEAAKSPLDLQEGARVFRKNCSACHRIDGDGHAVGPDISDMRTQTEAQIVHAILDPNAAVDANYFRYQVVTTSGQLVEGLLLDQNPSGVTLKQQDAKSIFLPRDEIDQANSSPLSMMPEGFEQSIPVEEMRQLVNYLKNWRFN